MSNLHESEADVESRRKERVPKEDDVPIIIFLGI